MRTILLSACAATMFATAAQAEQEPTACEPTIRDWWAKQIHRAIATGGAHGVHLDASVPEMGIAAVTWMDGTMQVVEVAYLDGLGACAINRRTVPAFYPIPAE